MFSGIGRGEISSTADRISCGSPGRMNAIGIDSLTRRELDVLVLLAEGYSTKEVAARLEISFKTAACHRYRILSKFGVGNTVAVVRIAIRQGLIDP